jgi:acetyl esterase/lipase
MEDPLVPDLGGRGWAVWNLEYRRLGWRSRGGWPGTLEDVAAGIDELGRLDAPLDLARVVAIGHSAGGHLALWAAARRGLPAGAPGAEPAVRPAASRRDSVGCCCGRFAKRRGRLRETPAVRRATRGRTL